MNKIFVFGSNLAGRHGAGAAKFARERFGAVYGVGVGRTGQSYAIPTKDENLKTLPLQSIEKHVYQFHLYTLVWTDAIFVVTRIGCGLAGYKDEDIAPMFDGFPDNCVFDLKWRRWLGGDYQYFFN